MSFARYPRYPAFAHSIRGGSTVGAMIGVAAAALVGMVVGGAGVFAVVNVLTPPPPQAPSALAQDLSPQDLSPGVSNAIRTVAGSAPDPSAGLPARLPVGTGKASRMPQSQVSVSAATPVLAMPPPAAPPNPAAVTQDVPHARSVEASPGSVQAGPPSSPQPGVALQTENAEAESVGQPGAAADDENAPPRPALTVPTKQIKAGSLAARESVGTRALYNYSGGQSGLAARSGAISLYGLNPPRSGSGAKPQAARQPSYARNRDRYYQGGYDVRGAGGFFGSFGGNRGWND